MGEPELTRHGSHQVEEFHDVFEELMDVTFKTVPEDMPIERTCFKQSCASVMGHSECRFSKMECARATSWRMVQTDSGTTLMSSQSIEHIHGLLDVVEHRKPVNPKGIVTMRGIPAHASPQLVKAMKQQDKLLKKVSTLEIEAEKMDPLQKQERAQWITLAKGVQHMAPGPAKLKSIHLLMNLAHNIAIREIEIRKQRQVAPKATQPKKPIVTKMAKGTHKKEPEQAMKVVAKKKALETKIRKLGGKKLLRKVQRAAFKKMFPNMPVPKKTKMKAASQ